MPSGECFYWDEVADPLLSIWLPAPSRLVAIWPARVNADACFEKAGFQQWSDGVPEAEGAFLFLVTGLVRSLEAIGAATLRKDTGPLPRRGHLQAVRELFSKRSQRPAESSGVVDALVAAAESEEIPGCVVTFGEPPQAAVSTSEGHDVLWVRVRADLDVARILRTAAQERALQRLTLDWTALLPG